MRISHQQFIKDYYKLNRNKYINPNSWGGNLPKSWLIDVFYNLSLDIILKIFRNWRKIKLPEEILKDLKECLNYKTLKQNYFKKIIYNNDDKTKELIYHLIYFGLEIDNNIQDAVNEIDNKIRILKNKKQFLLEVKAGKKIANYIEIAMDDEFEMKPLRTKIDLGKIQRLIKNKQL